MKKEELYYDSRDGIHKIHALRYLPEGQPVGIVQIVHGMAEHIGRYEELAQFLTQRGYVVTGEDHLGHGGSSAQGEPYGYFCEQDPATVLVRDVHRLKKMTQELFPGLPYVILGHSLGSFILRSYLMKYGTGIDGALLLGTGSRSAPEVLAGKLLAGLQSAGASGEGERMPLDQLPVRTYLKRIPDPCTPDDWLTGCPEEVDGYRKDEACGFVLTINGFRTLFELVSRIQDKKRLPSIPKDLPIHLMAGLDDPVGNYGHGVQKVYEAYQAAGLQNVTMKLYPEDRHELLHEKDRENVMEDIAAWLQEICTKGRS